LKSFATKLPETMSVPDELACFFNWAESNNCLHYSVSNEPFLIVDPSLMSPKSTSSIMIHLPEQDEWWLGNNSPEYNLRLCVFARTGGDGSSAAFWLDEDGKQQIVHLGSGSGSTMIGKWVDSPLDFLRLIAIGYDELCWPEDFEKNPRDLCDPEDEFFPPTALQQWLKEEFDACTPVFANEIVSEMSKIGEPSEDPFCKWVNSINPP